MKNKIVFMVGCSGIGKSTFVRNLIKERTDEEWVVLGRDELRLLSGMDRNDYWNTCSDEKRKGFENTLSDVEKSLIDLFLKEGKNIVIDNTNLKPKYINPFIKYLDGRGGIYMYDLMPKQDTDETNRSYKKRVLELLFKREDGRELNKKVGKEVLENQLTTYIKNRAKLMELFSESKLEKFKLNCNLKDHIREHVAENIDSYTPCVVFDLDGTMADSRHRRPHEYWKIKGDVINKQMKKIALRSDLELIFLTARNESGRVETEKWLNENGFKDYMLIMRPLGESHTEVPSSIYKDREIEKLIRGWCKFPFCVYEDNKSVINRLRWLGLNVVEVEIK